jgi:hypothetical protein
MQDGDSLPNTQETVTGSYIKTGESNRYRHILFLYGQFSYGLRIYP